MSSSLISMMETPKPNWLELPRDLTINIFQRLDTLQIVETVSVVCPLWWNICKDPLIWRTIYMTTDIDFSWSFGDSDSVAFSRLEKICRYAVDRSSGHFKDIYIKRFGTDDLLLHIGNSKSNLRCIKLEECHGISSKVFCEVVMKQPLLEELDIAYCGFQGTEIFECIGQCCPLLKSLKFSPCSQQVDKCDDIAFAIGKTMSRLQHLMILNNGVTNDGLLAILDGCPLLESLDIRGCRHLDLNGSLGKRCNEQIKELRFLTESVDLNRRLYDYMNAVCCRNISNMTAQDFAWIDEIPFDISNFSEQEYFY